MVNRSDKSAKTCLDGWKMNSQQRHFLESFFPGDEKQDPKATAKKSFPAESGNNTELKLQGTTPQLKRMR